MENDLEGKADEQNREFMDNFRMFVRYMKDAWDLPEGEGAILHAMKILGRFKRHEKMLRNELGECGVFPILTACDLIRELKAKRSEV